MRLTREAALVFYRAFSDVAGKGAFLLVTVFAARRLSQHDFGIFSIGTTLGWMAAVATDFGIQLHLAGEVARRPQQASRLLRAWFRVRLWTSLIAVAAVTSGLMLVRFDTDETGAIVLLLLVYIVAGLTEFVYYFYRGLSRSELESTLTLWQRFGTLVAGVFVLVVRPDVTLLALAMLLPGLATLAYSWRRAAQLAASQPNAAESPGPPAPLITGRHLHDVVPIGIGIVLSALYFRIDVFLLELWKDTDAVALYNAVFRLVEALRLFSAAVVAVALPTLFRATSVRPLLSVSVLVAGFSVVVAVALGAAAPWLVPLLYGDRYAAAVAAFRILLAALPLMSLNYVLTHQLVGWSGQRAFAVICATALVFNIAANARLIPALSIAGAAWSTLATEGLLTVACAAALWMRAARPSEGPLTATVLP